MEYKGQLFGKVGKSYFPLIKTAEEVDKIEAVNKKMVAMLEAVSTMCVNLHLTIVKNEIDELIKQATEV